MPTIIWGNPGNRTYESGLDRGVLYLPDGTAVPWNGLISVVENFSKNRESVYYDGMKISDQITIGDFAATMRAASYPREFDKLESAAELRRGVVVNDQAPESFGLSYRTLKGNDLQGLKAGYKLHVVYNLTAIPSDKNYSTLSSDPSLVEFEWSLSGVPEEVPGFRPTSHLTFESDKLDPWLFEELEEILYGSQGALPTLPPMKDLVAFLSEWARIQVIDNRDGTWTMIERRPGSIFTDPYEPGVVHASNVNAIYLDLEQDTYLISNTVDTLDLLEVRLNGDGTWSAITDNDAMVEVVDGVFTLRDIEPLMSGPEIFRIQSKTTA